MLMNDFQMESAQSNHKVSANMVSPLKPPSSHLMMRLLIATTTRSTVFLKIPNGLLAVCMTGIYLWCIL